jgi:hypothetical protein
MGIRKLLLGHTRPHLEPDDPQAGESTIASAAACTIKRGVAWVGGDLIVTNQRLIFNPWYSSDLTKLTSQGLKFVPIPHAHHMTTVVGSAQRLGTQADADSGLITAVSVGQPAGLARPPTIVVERSNGAPLEFGIARSQWTRPRSHRNIVARDRILAAAKAALGC